MRPLPPTAVQKHLPSRAEKYKMADVPVHTVNTSRFSAANTSFASLPSEAPVTCWQRNQYVLSGAARIAIIVAVIAMVVSDIVRMQKMEQNLQRMQSSSRNSGDAASSVVRDYVAAEAIRAGQVVSVDGAGEARVGFGMRALNATLFATPIATTAATPGVTWQYATDTAAIGDAATVSARWFARKLQVLVSPIATCAQQPLVIDASHALSQDVVSARVAAATAGNGTETDIFVHVQTQTSFCLLPIRITSPFAADTQKGGVQILETIVVMNESYTDKWAEAQFSVAVFPGTSEGRVLVFATLPRSDTCAFFAFEFDTANNNSATIKETMLFATSSSSSLSLCGTQIVALAANSTNGQFVVNSAPLRVISFLANRRSATVEMQAVSLEAVAPASISAPPLGTKYFPPRLASVGSGRIYIFVSDFVSRVVRTFSLAATNNSSINATDGAFVLSIGATVAADGILFPSVRSATFVAQSKEVVAVLQDQGSTALKMKSLRVFRLLLERGGEVTTAVALLDGNDVVDTFPGLVQEAGVADFFTFVAVYPTTAHVVYIHAVLREESAFACIRSTWQGGTRVIGVAASAQSAAGQTVSVVSYGVSKSHVALLPGAWYGYSTAGDVVAVTDAQRWEQRGGMIGKAVSPTELHVQTLFWA